jgi:hypothetical protein
MASAPITASENTEIVGTCIMNSLLLSGRGRQEVKCPEEACVS